MRKAHNSKLKIQNSKILFPLNYTLCLIFRQLAIVGDIYRGLYELHTQPWLSITYTIFTT